MHEGSQFKYKRYAHLSFRFFLVHSGIYQYIPGLSEYILVSTSINQYRMIVYVYIGIYQYVPCLSQYIQVCTWFVLQLTGLGYYLVHRSSSL